MSTPDLYTCCCCIELRRGCIFIGVMQMIGSLTGSALSVVLLQSKNLRPEDKPGATTMLVVSIPLFFIGIMLIVGAVKRIAGLLVPWLIAQALSIILYLIAFILICVKTKPKGDSLILSSAIGDSIFMWIQIILGSYFFYQVIRLRRVFSSQASMA